METNEVESLIQRETVPLEIHLPERSPFMPATIVTGKGQVVRVNRITTAESDATNVAAEDDNEPYEWEVAVRFVPRIEVCNLQ